MLERVPVRSVDLPPDAAWAEGFEVSLPRDLAAWMTSGGAGRPQAAFAAAAADLRSRACFTTAPPVTARLPFSYQRVPGPLRRLMAKQVGRWHRRRTARWAAYPAWPLDLSADFASDAAGLPKVRYGRTPVLLSHDIDTAEGLRNLAAMFIDIEEAVGARSANYIVPCAWPIDEGLVAEVASRGHEIGVHGYDHGNRTAFLPEDQRASRLAAGHRLAAKWGGTGYRAPSLLRTPALLRDLAGFYAYDSSIPTAGGLFPTPNNGCASARPWRIGTLWEIPLTLPRDGSLRFLGHTAGQIGALWRECAELIRRSGGVVSVLTHCERGFSGNPEMVAAYRAFLSWLAADGRFAFVLPRDLLPVLDGEAA